MRKTTYLTFKSFLSKDFFETNVQLFTFKKRSILHFFFIVLAFTSFETFAQVAVPFTARELAPGETSIRVKGDILLIGNSVIRGVGSEYDPPYDGTVNNNNLFAEYIDIDNDPNTFSSSSADLDTNISCKKIVYAGLYWASAYPNGVGDGTSSSGGSGFGGTPRDNDWNQIKFKLPTGNYIDLTATGTEIILDGLNANYDDGTPGPIKDGPIVCYKDVTSLLQGLTDADGTYTVANLNATLGRRNGGCAGGWTLVVIYESPDLPSKFISTFDGYAVVQNSEPAVDIPISGFQTLPAPLPVNARMGVASLEGDYGISGDSFQFRANSVAGFTRLFDALNPNNNFFNSRITFDGTYMTNRNPNSQNNLGFDIKNIDLPNPGNMVLPNDETGGTLRLTTSGDGIGPFLTTFAVDVIEPKIVLTKAVLDTDGNYIGGNQVNLGDPLNYVITIENIGNDDAQNVIIKDILPINVNYNHDPSNYTLSDGVNIVSYNPATREIIFSVDNDKVRSIGGVVSTIEFGVTVVTSCNELSDACSDIIQNQAFSAYSGVTNPGYIITDEPSFVDDGTNSCLLAPQATNFLADVDGCTYDEDVVLCGDTLTLTAPGGYTSYIWSSDPNNFDPTNNLGTTQSITVTSTGTYYVENTEPAPCRTTVKQFNVTQFGASIPNPVIDDMDTSTDIIEICGNDGKELPVFFLCGENDFRNLNVGLSSDVTSVVWEILDDVNCAAGVGTDITCANEDITCNWTELVTAPDYRLDTAGEYRVTINYDGGCFNRFYFNAYSNLLDATITKDDIICDTQGKITVNNLPTGYLYNFNDEGYTSSNTYDATTPKIYNIKIRQDGVATNPCIFEYNIQINSYTPVLVLDDVIQPQCFEDKGTVNVVVNAAQGQYQYFLSQGGTPVSSSSLTDDSFYSFDNLNPGIYDIQVLTDDGCDLTGQVEILAPDELEATVSSTPITCVDGEITLNVTGGTAPYYFFINGATDFTSDLVIPVSTPGDYDIVIIDDNGCTLALDPITINQIAPPVFTVNSTDVACYGVNSGGIVFNVTNANGYTIAYSIDNGANYVTNPTFSNLSQGTYQTMIRYSLNGVDCFSITEDVVIGGAGEALTASAGVSELAGCGPNGEGKVRITNPQGGMPPYEYSFDNQTTWGTLNEADVFPGTYTLYIRDTEGCIFAMPGITVDPEPEDPTIAVTDPVFNCDGSANATATITNPGGANFEYTYLIDGVENPNTADPTTFLNISEGEHTVSVIYKLIDVPTYSNLLLETFGSGPDVESPGINTAFYCFERQVVATQCKNNIRIQDGDYSVTAHIVSPYGPWLQPGDHTTNNADPNGRALVVNIGDQIPTQDVLYKKTINDIIPNQPINVELYAFNLLNSSNSQFDPNLTVALVDASGVEISSFATGNIPKSEQWEYYPKTPLTLNPGNNTTLDFIVRSSVRQTSGNDVAIDDIKVYQLPRSCTTQVDFPITISAGNAFLADVISTSDISCFGANDGEIEISATHFDPTNGYQYSTDAGTTWNTVTTSPYTIIGLGSGIYDVHIRFDTGATEDIADPDNDCYYTFSQEILEPTEMVLTVDATPVTCVQNSTVTATTTGGTPSYSYELYDDLGTTLIATFPANGILTNVVEGDYLVRVTDANNCTNGLGEPLSITGSTAPTASLINVDYCYDTTTNGASIEVAASGGNPAYQYRLGTNPYQANPIFNNLTPGTYEVNVRDTNGCELDLPISITIEPQVQITASLDKVLDCTISPDAEISGIISNGYAPYTYAVSIDGAAYTDLGAIGTTYTYTASVAGTYQFQVTDANSCTNVSPVITVNPITLPTATTTDVNPSCNGNANGSVEIIAANGQAPYTYSFNGSGFTTTTTYTGLAIGTYAYIVRDALGCEYTDSTTLTEPTSLTATAAVTTPFTCDASNVEQAAVVTIDVPTTGTAPYQYSFNGGISYSSPNTLSVNNNGSNQTINYSVRDANGCTAGGSLVIDALDAPTALSFTSSAVTCNATTTTVNVTATGGVGVLTYEITAPAPAATSNNTGDFAGLTPDTYVFKVTDANGCFIIDSYTVNPVTPIALIARKLSDVDCFGASTGQIELEVSGFSGTYAYSVNGTPVAIGQTATTFTLPSLVAGPYTIEVEDETTGCTALTSMTITQPASALSIDSVTGTDVFCTEDNSQITITASGGTLNYGYAAVVSGSAAPTTFAPSNVVTVDTNFGVNLVWDVYVEDANGCIENTTVTLTSDPMPTVTVPPLASNQCTASSGFTFDATGTGEAPLAYSINGGASYQTSPTFTVNTPGTYTVRVRDANGCTADSGNITIYEPLTGSAILTKDLTCSLPVEATIDLVVSGGNTSSTYIYQVSYNSGAYSNILATATYSASVAGTYQFKFIDANACEVETEVITVNPIVNPDIINVTQTQTINCNGEATAAIDITHNPALGLAPFVFNVFNTTTSIDYGTQTSGLTAGDYTITITDAKGCTDTFPITINEPDPIVPVYHAVPITCNALGVSKGSVVVDSVTGGTAPYNYFVTGTNGYSASELNNLGTTSTTFDVVDFGLYQINIVDSNGCSILIQDVLVASPPDDLDININAIVDCATGGEADVSIGTATTITGAGPFYFAIYTIPGMVYDGSPAWQLGAGTPVTTTFTGLIPGVTYTFIVYDDDTKCYYYETATLAIPTNSTLTINNLDPHNITCTGNADGSVSFDIESSYGVGTNVSYEILDSQSLVSTGISGTGTVPAGGTLSVTNLGALDFGNYIVVIEETSGANSGCSVVTDSFNITESAILLDITASSSKNENCNELGVVSAIATDGTAPYEYLLLLDTDPVPDASTPGWASPNTFTRAAGNYTAYVKDAYGCIMEADVTVGEDLPPTIAAVPQQCFDGTSINITLVESSGSTITPLTYSIGTGGTAGAYTTTDNFTITAAGTYDLFVKDANGCIATTTYVVNTPLLLDAEITKELDCTVNPDAQITLTPSGGVATVTYTYEVDYNGGGYTPIAGTPYTATAAGTYQFRVTNDQTCTAESVVVTVDPIVTPTLASPPVANDVTCNGGSDGSIVVTAGAGVAPFEYSNDGGVTFQSSNVFNGLIAGTYDIVIRDSKNCESLPVAVVINELPVVVASATLTNGLTCGVGNVKQNALVTVSGAGGTGTYTYSFDGINYSSVNTFNTNLPGTVNYWVKDANGCIDNNSIIVPDITPPSDLDFVSTTVTCIATTSDVTVTATDGEAPYNYEIIYPTAIAGGVSATDYTFVGLVPETYTFRVTDVNGCYYDESYTVDPAVNVSVAGYVDNDVSCNGGTNGAATFTVTNVPTTYTAVLTLGTGTVVQAGNTITVTDLIAGLYTIQITDNTTGCTDTADFTITEPAAALGVTATATNIFCTKDESQITIVATDGTPNYKYAAVISGNIPAPSDYTLNANVLTVDTNSGTDLSWDVYVEDLNGCTEMTTVTILEDESPSVTVPTDAICSGTTNGFEFTATNTTVVGVPPFEYSIGNGFQTSPTFTGLVPGDYIVTIKDGNGCTGISGTITVHPSIDGTLNVITLPMCLTNDGEISVTAEGGSGSYNFELFESSTSLGSGTVTGDTSVFSGLAASTDYDVVITDNITGCTKTVSTNLEAPTPVTFSTSSTVVTCNGGSDGTITVTLPISNNNPIYTYSIDGGTTTQTSNIFSGLSEGTYNITVTSERGCTLTQAETVGEPAIIMVPMPTVVEYACTVDTNTSNFATITVDELAITGGSSNYTIYEFVRGTTVVQRNGNNIFTETDYLGGTYTINVYDDKGCVGSTTTTINPFISIEDLVVTVDAAITCPTLEDITVSVTSASTTLEYTVEDVIIDPNTNTRTIGSVYTQTNSNGIFTGLDIGNYIVSVINTDTGCFLTTYHYVSDPNTFDLTIDNVVDVTCFTDNDGAVDVTFIDRTPTPTDDAGAFSYAITDASGAPVTSGTVASAGPQTITGLMSGTYTITATLTNSPECTISKAFTITGPTAALTAIETHTEITCITNDGTISASATGGWPGGYEYQLEEVGGTATAFSTTYTFTGLDAGDYNVNVRDSKGCIATTPVTLVNPTPIVIDATSDISMLACYGDSNATITVNSTIGGQGSNYTYTLNKILPIASTTGPQTATTFTGLDAGTYTVTATDGWSCSTTSTDIVINEPTIILSDLVLASTQTCLVQSTLTLSASGGTGMYEYSDDPNFGTVSGSFATDITFSVAPGTYQYYVRDANNCASGISNEILITPLPTLTVDVDATYAHINCYGDNTGVIVAEANGGLGNYTYTLQDASGIAITPAPVQNSPGIFTELVAGVYQVYVTSGDCEVTSTTVTINEPNAPLEAPFVISPVTCAGGNDGIIDISATGGTGIIKYAISPQLNQFFETSTFENLYKGDYQVVVQDEAGCFVIIDFTVDEPTPIVLNVIPNSIVPEVCTGDNNAAFSVTITGGVEPYSVALDDINGNYTTGAIGQTQFDFTGLTGGDHFVYVRDAQGCESEWEIDLPESVNLDPQVTVEYDCLNNTSVNRVIVTVDDSVQDLTQVEYALNGGVYQASNIFIDVPGGDDQYVDVRYVNGCVQQTLLFEIDHIAPLQVTLDDGNLNQIVAIATGGVEPYEYSLNGGSFSSDDKFQIYASGDYTVTVRDYYGCEASSTGYFEFIDVCIPNYFTPNGDGNLDEWGPGCTTQYRKLVVLVFDRYGREVAVLNVDEKWDGTYKGKELPSGDYWYIVKLNDPKYDKDFVGHFTIYR